MSLTRSLIALLVLISIMINGQDKPKDRNDKEKSRSIVMEADSTIAKCQRTIDVLDSLITVKEQENGSISK